MGEPGRCVNIFRALTNQRRDRFMAHAILRRHTGGRSFYVYLHRRATDGAVFYVGKGCRSRAKSQTSRNPHWQNIVAKHGFLIEYVAQDVQGWYALELERDLIALYGRETLCNLTDGGDGVSGLIKSEAARRAVSEAQKGRGRSPEWCAASSARQAGKVIPMDVRASISASVSAAMKRPEVIEKMRAAKLGKKRAPHSEETKAKMRAASLGKAKSQTARMNMSIAQRKRFAAPQEI